MNPIRFVVQGGAIGAASRRHGHALRRKFGHARRVRHDPLTTSEHEALVRAATRPGAWTRSSLRVRAADLDELIRRGYVRRIDGYPYDVTHAIAMYEITPEGRRAIEGER